MRVRTAMANRPRRAARASVRSVSVTPRVDDPRFGVPLYTIGEAGRFLAVPTSTFASWAKGYDRRSEGLDRWRGGDAIAEVAADFGVPAGDIEDVLRATLPAAA